MNINHQIPLSSKTFLPQEGCPQGACAQKPKHPRKGGSEREHSPWGCRNPCSLTSCQQRSSSLVKIFSFVSSTILFCLRIPVLVINGFTRKRFFTIFQVRHFPPVSIYPAFIARLSWKRPCAVSRGREMSGVWSRPKGLLGLSPPQTPAEMTAGMYAPSKSVLK